MLGMSQLSKIVDFLCVFECSRGWAYEYCLYFYYTVYVHMYIHTCSTCSTVCTFNTCVHTYVCASLGYTSTLS